jgi:hypothetical protein
MAKHKQHITPSTGGKLGSDPDAIHAFGGKSDFGVPADDRIEREYTSKNTKASDRGAAQARSSEDMAERTHGAGGKATGEGSSSGGDIDTDFVGIAGGTGLAADIPTEVHLGADDDTWALLDETE